MVTFLAPSGKVNLAVPLLSAVDSELSFEVIEFPLTVNVGTVFTDSMVGFPASEVMTTLSFHPLVLESISVINILKLLTAFVKVTVVVTADSPDPDLGSRLRPSVFIPPKAEFSILGYPASHSTSVFSSTFIITLFPRETLDMVSWSTPDVQFHGEEPQSELTQTSVSPVDAVPLSLASISDQLVPLSFDTCQCSLEVPLTLYFTKYIAVSFPSERK